MAERRSSDDNLSPSEEDEEIFMYKKSAVSVINFKIVYSENDLKGSKKSIQFKPEMAHQVFGDSENIFGYRAISLDIYYLHNSSRCWVDLTTGGRINRGDIEPDNIMRLLKRWLPKNYTREKEQFLRMIRNEIHDTMYGTVLTEFTDNQECKLFPGQNVISKYKVTLCDTQDKQLRTFHKRFETFIVWFIDAANTIDLSDEKWMVFYIYEEFEHPKSKSIYRSPIGYCSAYKFFAYPDKIRARISQFFILPSHQKKGIGSKFYQAVVDKIKAMPEVIDLTVEEPTKTFQKIRDYYDCITVQKELEAANIDIATGSQKKVFELMRKLKICKRQSQRVYDILGCFNAGKWASLKFQKYMRIIKQRIANEIERDSRGSKKICNLERMGIVADAADIDNQIEVEFKRYIDDIEPSIKYLQQHPVANNTRT